MRGGEGAPIGDDEFGEGGTGRGGEAGRGGESGTDAAADLG